jgi:hypothetical protein
MSIIYLITVVKKMGGMSIGESNDESLVKDAHEPVAEIEDGDEVEEGDANGTA